MQKGFYTMAEQSATEFFFPSDLMERAFAVIFERLDDDARTQPQYATYYESQRGCFERALEMFRKGFYPAQLHDGAWLMPSETGPAIVHLVRKEQLPDSSTWVWKCGKTCKCRSRFHKHGAYLRAIEQAMELADQEDDGDVAPPDPDTLAIEQLAAGEPPAEYPDDEPPWPTELAAHGRRLALARAERATKEMNELFAA